MRIIKINHREMTYDDILQLDIETCGDMLAVKHFLDEDVNKIQESLLYGDYKVWNIHFDNQETALVYIGFPGDTLVWSIIENGKHVFEENKDKIIETLISKWENQSISKNTLGERYDTLFIADESGTLII